MRARRFPTAHHPIGLPGGNEDNDLWVRRELDGSGGDRMASVWEPSPDERAALATGANVELLVAGTLHPPVAMHTTREQATANPQRVDDSPRIWLEFPRPIVLDTITALDGRLEYLASIEALSAPGREERERLEAFREQLAKLLAVLDRATSEEGKG